MIARTVLACLVCLTPAVRSQAEPATVPFDPSTGHIVVRASLNGSDPRIMILDTGNQQTVIYQRVADELGLDTEPLGQMGGAGSGQIQVRQAEDVRVSMGAGDAAEQSEFTEPLVVIVPDANQLPDFNGQRVDGFLGASLIERFIISIDYDAGMLTLHDPEMYEVPENARTAEMKLWHGFPYFEGSVTPKLHGKPTEAVVGNFLLDLGATYAADIDHGHAKQLGLIGSDDPAITTDAEGRGIDGVPFMMMSAPAHAVSMGGLDLAVERVTFQDSPGGGPPIPDLVGNVGSGAFPGEIVTLDYPNERLILTPAE